MRNTFLFNAKPSSTRQLSRSDLVLEAFLTDQIMSLPEQEFGCVKGLYKSRRLGQSAYLFVE